MQELFSRKFRLCKVHIIPTSTCVALGMWTSHAVKRTKQSALKNITGRRIREARLRSRSQVSQEDLAGRLAAKGITLDQTAISRIESRERYVMDYEVAAIARSLRIPVAELFGEDK